MGNKAPFGEALSKPTVEDFYFHSHILYTGKVTGFDLVFKSNMSPGPRISS